MNNKQNVHAFLAGVFKIEVFAQILGNHSRIHRVLEGFSDFPEEMVLFMIYSGKFPEMSPRNKNDVFLQKHSSAKDEWCMNISSILAQTPYHMGNLIERLYNSDKTEYWSNEDDFSFYAFVGEYQSRKFRIIFYHSDDKHSGEKVPFQKLVKDNIPIRICWY